MEVLKELSSPNVHRLQSFNNDIGPAERLNRRNVTVKGTFPGAPVLQFLALERESLCYTVILQDRICGQKEEIRSFLVDDRLINDTSLPPEVDLIIATDHYYSIVKNEVITSNTV